MLLIFCLFAGLMMTRRLPALLSLPAMGLSIGLLVSLHHRLDARAALHLLGDEILGAGSVSMAPSMVVAFAGGALGQVISRQRISQALVSRAAEYAGDRHLPLLFLMLIAVALNFTAISGVGAILMVGNLVLPTLVAAGISPLRAGVTMLFGIALGGLVNPLALQIYIDLLKVPMNLCLEFALGFQALLLLAACFFIFWGGRRPSFAWAAESEEGEPGNPGLAALVTPVVPLLLMVLLKFPPLVAILISLIYGCLVVEPKLFVSNLTRSLVEGIQQAAPMVAVFIGLGIALQAVNHPLTREILAPALSWGLPRTAPGFVLYFSLLAPLSTYRGPLTLYGLGGGVAAMMVSVLPVGAVLAAFLCLGQFQSICDPTCTHSVCVAQILNESPERLAWAAAPFVWSFVVLGLSWAVLWHRPFF